jgi:mono/diheme cytochrome c family protein
VKECEAGRRLRGMLLLGVALVGLGCAPDDATLSPLALEGQRVYRNVCIACHNGDPNLDGSPGPAIAGSSRALLEARVIHGTYPPGYQPKRSSAAMPRFAFLADKIDALAAYLGEVKRDGAER